MAWKGRENEPTNIDPLIVSLNNSRIQTENNALYQTIQQIILFVQRNAKITQKNISQLVGNVTNINFGPGINIAAIINAIININTILASATFVTVNDETTNLPNSYQLVAGTNITLDTTTPNQVIINSSGGGSNTDHVVLSDGVVAGPTPVNDGAGNFIYIPYVP